MNFANQINEKNPYRKTLEDVVILHLAFCLLIVLYHALCPYGIWVNPIEGIGFVETYKQLGFAIVNLAIPGFVFVSGYLLGYTLNKQNRLFFNDLVVRKIKRLLIPSVVFSAIYLWLYTPSDMSVVRAVYETVNGYAHLWFLPMLFNCFIITWLLNRLQFQRRFLLVSAVVIFLTFCPDLQLPLQISKALRYYLYFYLGFGLQQGYLNTLMTPKTYHPILYGTCVALGALALIAAVNIAPNNNGLWGGV